MEGLVVVRRPPLGVVSARVTLVRLFSGARFGLTHYRLPVFEELLDIREPEPEAAVEADGLEGPGADESVDPAAGHPQPRL